MKIYVFLAEGFEEIEAIAPIDIFRRAGMDVLTVSVTGKQVVAGAHQIVVQADELFENVNFDSHSLIFLPGGLPGTTNLGKHLGLKELIEKQASANAKIAAICAAPSILGEMGLLKDKEAICYPGFEDKLTGASLSGQKMVQADNVFTAKAAGVAIQFALKIVADLKGLKVAEQIQKSIYLD